MLCALSVDPMQIERCTMDLDVGNGTGSEKRFYFKTPQEDCTEFVYTGRGGNENNFETFMDCVKSCKVDAHLPGQQR